MAIFMFLKFWLLKRKFWNWLSGHISLSLVKNEKKTLYFLQLSELKKRKWSYFSGRPVPPLYTGFPGLRAYMCAGPGRTGNWSVEPKSRFLLRVFVNQHSSNKSGQPRLVDHNLILSIFHTRTYIKMKIIE